MAPPERSIRAGRGGPQSSVLDRRAFAVRALPAGACPVRGRCAASRRLRRRCSPIGPKQGIWRISPVAENRLLRSVRTRCRSRTGRGHAGRWHGHDCREEAREREARRRGPRSAVRCATTLGHVHSVSTLGSARGGCFGHRRALRIQRAMPDAWRSVRAPVFPLESVISMGRAHPDTARQLM